MKIGTVEGADFVGIGSKPTLLITGFPVVVSDDAPADKIVVHPDVLARLERNYYINAPAGMTIKGSNDCD